MPDNAGFLQQLTGAGDEEAIARARVAEDIKQGGRMAQMAFGLGSQAAGGLGVAAKGLITAGLPGRMGGEKGAGFKANFKRGADDGRDRLIADANGISPEELRSRRAIREEFAKSEYADDGTHASRIKMARRAIEIANSMGDGVGVAKGIDLLKSLELEKAEFDKLQSGTTGQNIQNTEDSVKTGFNADGTPVSGVLALNEDGQAGLNTTENGQLVHKVFDEKFSLNEPEMANGIAPFQIASQIKKNNGVAFVGKIKGLASTANTALAKTDRVLDTLTDLFGDGLEDDSAGQVISKSGGFLSGADNLARNVQGIVKAFTAPEIRGLTHKGVAADAKAGVSSNGEVRSWAGKSGLIEMANDFAEFIQLPEGVERTSAAAQQHRAAVMEMAYMAARLAEPSNRGLSDNDIKNALTRIAGDTSNPQVMMRRFLEMQVDAAHELDFELRLLHGSLGPNITDEQINIAMVGKGYAEYKARKDAMFKKYNVTEGDAGRVQFGAGATIGTDVAPGETINTPNNQRLQDMDDDAFLSEMVGVPAVEEGE